MLGNVSFFFSFISGMNVVWRTWTDSVRSYIIIALAFYVYPDDAKDIGSFLDDFFKPH